VKITDVGLSKNAKDITGTFAGTPAYIAPEVFRSKVYDNKADIYSFGIMMWEMWYGQQAFAEIMGPIQRFAEMVDKGHRPKDVEGSNKPPHGWKQLMERCWDASPEQRPSAEICNQEIRRLLDQKCDPMV